MFKKRCDYSLKVMMIVTFLATLIMIVFEVYILQQKLASPVSKEQSSDIIYKKYYAFVVPQPADSFWTSVYEAAKEEGKKHNIYVEMIGSDMGGTYLVNDGIKIAIASHVDGILVVPEDEESVMLLEEAHTEGIPVVTLNNDGMKEKRVSFVGVSSSNLAKAYAEEIIKLKDKVKKVTVLMDASTSANNKVIIYGGIKQKLEQEGIEVTTVAINKTNAFSTEEAIRNMMLNPAFISDVVVCLSAEDTICAYQALVDYNRVGNIQIIGTNKTEDILEAISKKIIYSTIVVNPDEMGIKGIQALEKYETKGYVSSYFTVDIGIIGKEEVKYYLEDGGVK